MALYIVSAATLCISLAIGFLLYGVYRDTQYLVGRQKLYDQWAVADRALQEQRKAPLHKLSPPQMTRLGWVAHCSCGWEGVPRGNSNAALDEAEAHKAQMPQRRAV